MDQISSNLLWNISFVVEFQMSTNFFAAKEFSAMNEAFDQ